MKTPARSAAFRDRVDSGIEVIEAGHAAGGHVLKPQVPDYHASLDAGATGSGVAGWRAPSDEIGLNCPLAWGSSVYSPAAGKA